MKNITVDKYMHMLEPLPVEDKLELLSRLSESLKKNFFTIKSDKKNDTLEKNYDFFKSAGLFKDREIDASQLRKEAWKL